jgi:hypothetical protein
MAFIIYRSKENIAEPRFQCDRCGKLIQDAGLGILIWNEDYSTKTECIVPLVVCKMNCDDPIGRKEHRNWMDLSTAVAFLLNNVGLVGQKLERAKSSARMLARI